MGRYSKQSKTLFITLQAILYVVFLVLDLTGGSVWLSSKIKFIIIILCFWYALFRNKGADKSILFCVKVALFFTIISDLFILILDYYFYGVITFIVVQQIYSIRLSMVKYRAVIENRRVALIRSFLIRFAFQVGATIFACLILRQLGVALEGLLVASTLYFISIFMNAIKAVKSAITNPKEKSLILFAVGMMLFLLCDINVGLFNLSGYISLPKDFYTVVYAIASILMWAFYAPSQLMISLSVEES